MPALVEITGFTELQEKLKLVGDDKSKRSAMLAVLREVAKSTVRAAKGAVPVSTKPHLVSGKRTKKVLQPGTLKKSIGTITGTKGSAKINPTVYVGPKAKGNNDGFYGHFVEYGHNLYHKGAKRKHRGGEKAKQHNAGISRGRTRPQPFMQIAYEQTKAQVTADAVDKVVKVIQKQIDKLSV